MIAKIGDTLECEFGTGKLVACTEQWAILRREDGDEMCIYLKENWIAFPAEIKETVTDKQELTVDD